MVKHIYSGNVYKISYIDKRTEKRDFLRNEKGNVVYFRIVDAERKRDKMKERGMKPRLVRAN